MKRILILSFVFLFALAFAVFADTNTGNVNQTGNGNEAAVSQTGSSNNATVDQYGKNIADIKQNGNSNDADIDQGAAGSPVDNYKKPGYPGDWINGAYIKQAGSSNTARINERSSSTYAHIYQTGNGNMGSQDIGTYASKANANFTPNRGVQIDQTGDENVAIQETIASYGCFGIQSMDIDQVGNLNYAKQTSKGGMGSVMEIFQNGGLNNSTQSSDGMYDRTHAYILGNSNFTIQDQSTHVRWSNTNRYADIDIIGNNNIVNQTQTAPYQYGGPSVNDTADVDITGDSNTANQSQNGNNNNADIDIVGNSNNASQTQTGNLNASVILQNGNSNIAAVVQGP